MTDAWREQIMAANDDYAKGALRVLAIARRSRCRSAPTATRWTGSSAT